jgi:hypothetical protein
VTNEPSGRQPCFRALACLLALNWAGLVRAQAEPAPAEPVEEPASAPPQARPTEWFVAVLGGPAWQSAGEVQATSKGVLEPDVVVSSQVNWRRDAVAGLRLGAWFNSRLGAALELGATAAKAEGVTLRVTTLSLVPLVRLPLLRSAGEPEGRLRLYLGFSLTAAVEGHGSASFAGLPTTTSGSVRGFAPTGGPASLGAGVLAGLSLHLGPVVLFGEQRYARLSLTFTDLFQEVETTLVSRQTVLGVALRLP